MISSLVGGSVVAQGRIRSVGHVSFILSIKPRSSVFHVVTR